MLIIFHIFFFPVKMLAKFMCFFGSWLAKLCENKEFISLSCLVGGVCTYYLKFDKTHTDYW